MKFWPTIKKLLTYREPPAQESFSLDGRVVPDDPNMMVTEGGNKPGQKQGQGAQQPPGQKQGQQSANQQQGQQRRESWFSNIVQPKKLEELASQIDHLKQPGTPAQAQKDRPDDKAGKDGASKRIVTWSKPGNKAQQASQKNAGQTQKGQQQDGRQDNQQDQQGGQGQSAQNQAGQQPAPPNENRQSRNKDNQARANQAQASQAGQTNQSAYTAPTEGSRPRANEFSTDIEQNLAIIQQAFLYGTNKDIIVRKFVIPLDPPVRAFIVFLEGMADKKVINRDVLEPLMRPLQIKDKVSDVFTIVKERLLPGNQVEEKNKLKDLLDGILAGATALFVDDYPAALLADTKGIPAKSIERPQSEIVVRGPQEAFTELLRTNTALVRKRLRTEHLITEILKVGTLSHSDVAIMYIKGVVNPKLVAEVKRRIQAIKADYLSASGIIEQFIEDRPFFLLPQVLSTERPDRVAAFLTEGHVAILVESTPFALVVPVSFWTLLHSSEDIYLRWPFAIFLRTIRIMAIILAVFLPALYLAMVNYHWEMIPTDLLLAIAASRERVPFPAVVEVFIMELSFEIIREAGVRIPNVIGPTIGIVGALILGQAAVAASIISPILIIIVAMTALGSFVVPNLSLSFAVRLIRFYYILLAAFLGFFGIAVGLFIHLISITNLKSFGVPIFAPVVPRQPSGGDIILRFPIWMQQRRPEHVEPLDDWRQITITRPWENITPDGVLKPGEVNQQEHAEEKAQHHKRPEGDGQSAQ
ncbi:MAG: spore germination protein [Syntrophothermus sp.]